MSTISGKAIKYSGEPIDYVLLFDWISGNCIGKSVPDLAGNWSFNYYKNLNIGITYVADGCEPITHGSYQFVGIFNPAALFASGEDGVWYDPSDLSTMYQNELGTIPVTSDGQPVGFIRDKSGNNHNASQSIESKKPLYRTDGVLHWLEFDGIDDALITPSWIFQHSLSSHLCAGLQRLSGGIPIEKGQDIYIYAGDNDNADGDGWSLGYYRKGFSYFPNYANGAKSVLSLKTIGDKALASVDGVNNAEIIVSTPYPYIESSLTIGGRNGSEFFCKCNIYSLLLSRSESTDAAIEYVAEKSGVTL